MAQINSCLKSIFTVFNILFAIFGGLIIVLALVVQFLMRGFSFISVHGEENVRMNTFKQTTADSACDTQSAFTFWCLAAAGLLYFYLVGAIIIVIAILGAYIALKEKKWALFVFLKFMVLISLFMFRAGAFLAISRPQVKNDVQEVFHKIVPLDNSPEQDVIQEMQKKFHCCGLFSYRDWKQLPDSCMCDQEDVQEGECQSVGYRTKYVYTKTCYPIIEHYALLGFDIVLGVAFTMAVLALLGMILSSLMIHHIRYPKGPTALLTVPTVFTPQPPKYEELHNAPLY